MDLGTFSISLAVKDLDAPRQFYEKFAGPASFIAEDPDGNPVLFDQHV